MDFSTALNVSRERYFEFGPFRLDAAAGILFRGSRRLALRPKLIEILAVLVEAKGTLVTKEELLQKVWPGVVVEEGSITAHISLLRKILGKETGGRTFIETIPKRGYRFAASVKVESQPQTPVTGPRVMLMVLPFENFSQDKEQEYFSDGLTEEMITQLSRLNPEKLGVIARTSAMQYKSTKKPVQQIGRELGVAYILEGSVRRSRNRVRIAAQLVQVQDQTHVWAENYDRELDDILILQGEVAKAVAEQIKVKFLSEKGEAVGGSRRVNPQAYEAYLKGRYFWYKRTEEALKKGIDYFNRAIASDPSYAMAYVGLSDSYLILAARGIMPVYEVLSKAKAAVTRALEIDALLGEAHASLGHLRLHDWDWTGLDDELRLAIELNPGNAFAYYYYSEYLMAAGRSEEAIAVVKKVGEIDPISIVLNTTLPGQYYFIRQYQLAADLLEKASDLDPTHFLPHFRLGQVYIQERSYAKAIKEMQKAITLSRRSTETLAGLAQAYAAAGMTARMQELLDELNERSKHGYVSPYYMAKIYSALKDKDQTFRWLDAAYRIRNLDLIELNIEPGFDNLRSDPRFARLLSQIGLIQSPERTTQVKA